MSRKRKNGPMPWIDAKLNETRNKLVETTALRRASIAQRAALIDSGDFATILAYAIESPDDIDEVLDNASRASPTAQDISPKRVRSIAADTVHSGLLHHMCDDDIDLTKLPVSSIVPCRSCKKHNVVVQWTKQTRSADEPETEFYQCVHCHAQWRVN